MRKGGVQCRVVSRRGLRGSARDGAQSTRQVTLRPLQPSLSACDPTLPRDQRHKGTQTHLVPPTFKSTTFAAMFGFKEPFKDRALRQDKNQGV